MFALLPDAKKIKISAAELQKCTRSAIAAAFVDERHPFAAVHRMKHLRREVGASVTDTLRVLLLRTSGYAVSTGDFVSVEHTPKNTLITALRQRGPTRSRRPPTARGRSPPAGSP